MASLVPAAESRETMRGFAARLFAHFLERLNELVPVVLDTHDEEAIHDTRVATRRLRAALRVFRNEAGGRDAIAPINGELRWLAQTLGAVRDEDVFIEWAAGLQIENLTPLLDAHRGHRTAMLTAFLASAPRDRIRLFLEMARGFNNLLAGLAGPDDRTVRRGAPRALRRAISRAIEFREALPLEPTVPELHELRILCKRLRYTAEFFNPTYGGVLAPLIADATTLQDTLGGITDRHNHLRKLVNGAGCELAAESPILRTAVDRAIADCHAQQERLRGEFDYLWRHFTGTDAQGELAALLDSLEAPR